MITVWNNGNQSNLSEVSTSNILNYKRRSKLVCKTYSHDINRNFMTFKNEIDTLKNCYNFMYDLKNTLEDYISLVRNENRGFDKGETNKLLKILELSKSEIISASNLYKKYKNSVKYTIKEKRDVNKLIKMINDVSNVVVILAEEISVLF
jgi:hypothetical protein